MKKLMSLILAGAMAASLLAGCASGGKSDSADASGADAATSGDTIKLGGLAPLTGDVSVYGIATKRGVDLAIEEINANGGILGKQVEIEFLDEKGDVQEAVSAYQRLMSKNIVALIGDVTSKPSMAVAERAAKDGVPMMTPTGTAAGITTYGDNIFRTCFLDPFQGQIMATYAADNLAAKKVAIMYNVSDDYSGGVATAFEATAQEKGLEIVAKEGYNNDDTDFNTILTKIVAADVDALFIPDYYNKIALISKQARDAGFDKPMLGADGWDGVLNVLDDANKSAVDNSFFSNHYSVTDEDPIVTSFIAAYEKEYGETPNAFAALGYDAAYMMTQAITEANSTEHAAIVTALKALEYDGVTGHITFDDGGDPIKSVAIIKLQDGAATLDTKISVE